MKKVLCLLLASLLLAGACSAEESKKIGGTLNLLVMGGYEEDQIVKPFEEMYGVKVNAKIYPTSDQMFALLQNAKEGEWDLVTPDTPWVDKLVKADLIDELNPADYPEINNFYPPCDSIIADGAFVTICFSEPVNGDTADILLCNGAHVDEVKNINNTQFIFRLPVQNKDGKWALIL